MVKNSNADCKLNKNGLDIERVSDKWSYY